MFKKIKKIEELVFANDLVGCIGKLPIHMEFIKHRVTLAEIAQLDQWYQNAYHHLNRQYGTEFKEVFTKMPLHHFVYTTPERLPLIGTVIASQDQSGRAYPFVIFRLIEHPIANEFWSLIPLCYQEFFSETQVLCQSNEQDYSLPDLYKKINELNQIMTKTSRRDVLEAALKSLKTLSFGDFWHVFSSVHTTIDINKFILAFFQQMQSFKTRVLQNQFVGIRLPIMSGNNFAATMVIFWLQLLNTLLPEMRQYLQYFWNPNDKNHRTYLLVYFKPMPINCFANFLNDNIIDAQLLDVVTTAEKNLGYLEKINPPKIDLSCSLLETMQSWSKPNFCRTEN